MKKIVLIVCAMVLTSSLWAQRQYEEVLAQIMQNSPRMQALERHRDAQKSSVVATAMLEAPEVEFSYFKGSPTDIGNRWDLSVEQSFDLPGVYINRSKIRSLQQVDADFEYELSRIEFLKEVQMICSEVVYQKRMVDVLSRCAQNAQNIAQNYEKRMISGDCSILEYNRAQMEYASAENKLSMANLNLVLLQNKLKIYNGGKAIDYAFSDFAATNIINEEFSVTNYTSKNPALKALDNQCQIAHYESNLAKSEMLPRFSVGYASENVVGETFRGVTASMQLPLWNGAKGVRAAKTASMAKQQLYDNAVQELSLDIEGLYSKVQSLKQSVAQLQQSMSSVNSIELLKKSLDAGQISLEEYLLEVDFYIDSEISILDAQKELDQTLIELNSVLL